MNIIEDYMILMIGGMIRLEEKEIIQKRHYKIEAGDTIKVRKQVRGDYVFYKVVLTKKNPDDTIAFFEKNIAFNSGVNLEDGTKIRVLDFFEDVFVRKNDKFNANWTIHITDFEIVDNSELDAISEYSLNYDSVTNYSNNSVEDIETPF